VALSSFYEEGPEENPIEAIDDSPDEHENAAVVTKTAKKETKTSFGGKNFATLSSLNSSSSGDEGDEKGQAFYAGGSQTSGQQILGPPKKNPIKDYVSEVFRQAQSGNMEQFDSNESSSSGEQAPRAFVGTGYRLGHSENDPSVAVPPASSSRKKQEECDTVTVRVFRQGFTVDDGALRPYEDPRNREFFESITHNEIPAELRKQGRTMVHVNVEDHLSEDYVKRQPKFKPFEGSGNTLGNPAPATSADPAALTATGNPAENEARASSDLNIQEDQPLTNISIRLADGGRLSARFNLTHTVQDIRQFITTARPQYAGRSFNLLTTFPNKELSNPGDTIEQAGLKNSAILQRLT
jgi:UBX domain-containing protein 1